jgi:hypothetical protein
MYSRLRKLKFTRNGHLLSRKKKITLLCLFRDNTDRQRCYFCIWVKSKRVRFRIPIHII